MGYSLRTSGFTHGYSQLDSAEITPLIGTIASESDLQDRVVFSNNNSGQPDNPQQTT